MLTFDAEKHEYRWNGVVVPSVTQILKSLGLIDATWYTEEARDRGSMIHLATALDDRGELDESSVDERIAGYLAAWRFFLAESGFAFEEIEEPRYSMDLGYAGTADRIGKLRGSLAVGDIKTGSPEPWHRLQTAAYVTARFGNAWRVAARFVVYLSDDGKYRLITHTDPSDFFAWRACANLFNWRMNNA